MFTFWHNKDMFKKDPNNNENALCKWSWNTIDNLLLCNLTAIMLVYRYNLAKWKSYDAYLNFIIFSGNSTVIWKSVNSNRIISAGDVIIRKDNRFLLTDGYNLQISNLKKSDAGKKVTNRYWPWYQNMFSSTFIKIMFT